MSSCFEKEISFDQASLALIVVEILSRFSKRERLERKAGKCYKKIKALPSIKNVLCQFDVARFRWTSLPFQSI